MATLEKLNLLLSDKLLGVRIQDKGKKLSALQVNTVNEPKQLQPHNGNQKRYIERKAEITTAFLSYVIQLIYIS